MLKRVDCGCISHDGFLTRKGRELMESLRREELLGSDKIPRAEVGGLTDEELCAILTDTVA